jgi:transaldolase
VRSGAASLAALGQSVWYDHLTRSVARGGLDDLVRAHAISGVTSNPTIFEQAIAGDDGYTEQLRVLARRGVDAETAYWALVVDDIAAAADRLAPIHGATDGVDGFVSVEVSPLVADDASATIRQARELFARIARPNVMIKIPATPAGLPAITETIAAGINVNVTLIFSLDRYAEVIDAHRAGIARAADPGRVASVASFFVSRVDTEVDRRLPEAHPQRGRAAVANAKLAYELFRRRCDEEPWWELASRGARVQRPLWASTSTKNPAYSPTLYVDELIGPDTVNTLAPASIEALREHRPPGAATVLDGIDDARELLGSLAGAGVDLADALVTLERDGVAAFARSYRSCLTTIASALDAAA